MQTIKDLKLEKKIEEPILPEGYRINWWVHVLSHEMNVLFSALAEAVFTFDTKAEIKNHLGSVKGLKGCFNTLDKSAFPSVEDYEGYVSLLEKHKKFLERSNLTYPATLDEAIELFVKWGLLVEKGDVWDIPVFPFPDAQDLFTLNDQERAALEYLKVEALVHPVFSRLVLMLHEKDVNKFELSKKELKEMLNINDAMLFEVLIKLTPYLEEPIENVHDVPEDEKMEFTVIWERVYEDFLGSSNPQTIQQ